MEERKKAIENLFRELEKIPSPKKCEKLKRIHLNFECVEAFLEENSLAISFEEIPEKKWFQFISFWILNTDWWGKHSARFYSNDKIFDLADEKIRWKLNQIMSNFPACKGQISCICLEDWLNYVASNQFAI